MAAASPPKKRKALKAFRAVSGSRLGNLLAYAELVSLRHVCRDVCSHISAGMLIVSVQPELTKLYSQAEGSDSHLDKSHAQKETWHGPAMLADG